MNAFAFQLGSGIEVRFPVPELDVQGPESDAKIVIQTPRANLWQSSTLYGQADRLILCIVFGNQLR